MIDYKAIYYALTHPELKITFDLESDTGKEYTNILKFREALKEALKNNFKRKVRII